MVILHGYLLTSAVLVVALEAMAAGVPLVPIVIHDAGRVLPQGGWIMRSGVVKVSVLAPLETSDWSLDALDQKVEEVEAAYRLELSHR